MNENWQVGDHAVCVEDCTFKHPDCTVAADVPDIYYQLAPRRGQKFIVTAVEGKELPENYQTRFEVYLGLRGMPSDRRYLARSFRKLTPPEADEFDREIIAALTGQPEQVPAEGYDAIAQALAKKLRAAGGGK